MLSNFSPLVFIFILSISSLFTSVSAQTNVTIDDTNGDEVTGTQITYSPSDGWQTGQDCTTCSAKLDSTETYDGTWHDSTYYPEDGSKDQHPGEIISASVTFTGSAVYVYCILTGSVSSPFGNTDMTFTLDGSSAGSFEKAPDGNKTFAYNQVVFSKTGLGQGEHNITIEVGHNGTRSIFLLDRIVYTTTNSFVSTAASSKSSSTSTTSKTSSSKSTSSGSQNTNTWSLSPLTYTSAPTSSTTAESTLTTTSNSKTGTIVGVVVSSVSALVIIALLLWWFRRKHQRAEEEEAEKAIIPFFSNPRTGAVNFGSDYDGTSSPRFPSPWSPQTMQTASSPLPAWNQAMTGASVALGSATAKVGASKSSKSSEKRSQLKSTGQQSADRAALSPVVAIVSPKVRSPDTYREITRVEKARLAGYDVGVPPPMPPVPIAFTQQRQRPEKGGGDSLRPLPSTSTPALSHSQSHSHLHSHSHSHPHSHSHSHPHSRSRARSKRKGSRRHHRAGGGGASRAAISPFSPTPLFDSSNATVVSSVSASDRSTNTNSSTLSGDIRKYCPFDRYGKRRRGGGNSTTQRDRVRIDRPIDEEGSSTVGSGTGTVTGTGTGSGVGSGVTYSGASRSGVGVGAGEIIVGDKEGIPTEDYLGYGLYSVPLAPVRPPTITLNGALLQSTSTSYRTSIVDQPWHRRIANMFTPFSRGSSKGVDAVPYRSGWS